MNAHTQATRRLVPARLARACVVLTSAMALGLVCGCDETTDDQTRTLIPLPAASDPSTKPAGLGDLSRRSMRIIPFTAEFPRTWQMSSGSTGTTVIEANTPSGGDFDIFILIKDATTTQLMDLHLADARAAATRPSMPPAATTTASRPRESQRLLEIRGAQGIEYTQVDSKGLVTIRARLFVPSNASEPTASVDVFEVSISSLKPEQAEADALLIRSIIDSLQYDPAALRSGN